MTFENGKIPLPSRRDFISLGIGAFVVGTLPFAARGRRRLTRRTVPVMGTLGEIAVVHKDEAFAQNAMDAAFQELNRVESILTWFHANSDVGMVNLVAMVRPQPISVETAEVLRSSLAWAEGSGGSFDPCLGKMTALWDVGFRDTPPELDQVERFAHHGLYRDLELGRSGGQDVAVFHSEDISLDLGGIGKGYGVDRAVEVLRTWGIENALVNVGGDLYAMGLSEDGDPWQVGVRSPDDPNALATTLPMTDRAIATSGDYQQYFDYEGRRYHHLMDPGTGAPTQARIRSVTVAADLCMDADAGATTTFVGSVDEATQVFPRVAPSAQVVHSI